MSEDPNYDDPWPMYADEEEPWKDLERLLKLEQKMETQMEMGSALGCTPSTISYWLSKAHDDPDIHLEDGADIFCENCDGETPRFETICPDCLDDLRERDRVADYDDYCEYLNRVNDSKAEA